jgi:hypothetical protein
MWKLEYCSPEDTATYDRSIRIDSTKPLSELKQQLAEVGQTFPNAVSKYPHSFKSNRAISRTTLLLSLESILF